MVVYDAGRVYWYDRKICRHGRSNRLHGRLRRKGSNGKNKVNQHPENSARLGRPVFVGGVATVQSVRRRTR